MQEKDFLEKFDKYSPTSEQEVILRGNYDYTVGVDKNNRAIMVRIRFDRIISKSLLIETENAIRDAYGINYVRIVPSYPSYLFDEDYIPTALRELERRGAVSRGFFRDCTYSYRDGVVTLCVKIPDGGVSLLDDAKTADCFSDIIRDEFGISVKTEIRQPDGFEFPFEEYYDNLKRREDELLAEAPPPPAYNSSSESMPDEKNESSLTLKRVSSLYGRDPLYPEILSDGQIRCGNTVFDISAPDFIFGEPFDLSSPVTLRNIDKNGVNVCTFGKLIHCETRDFRNSERVSLSFAITDEDSSVFCRLSFDSISEAGKLLDILMKDGNVRTDLALAVYGRVRADKNDGELSINVSGIAVIGLIKRTDKSGRKRVELHLHTKMSAMDALIPPDDVVKIAEEWGHSAIAVTDHGNVQGFQDAMVAFEKLVDKKGDGRSLKKIIYGMEGYFVDDTSRAVYGDADADFGDDEFCVFDIETTGLSSHRDKIIEIGAVIFKGGKIIDVFCTYVDPGIPVPENITKLTGIKDSDVNGAPSQKDAVASFLLFAGNRILVAHNALFDIGFIRKACDDNGIDFRNTYMDTVAMSRYINPELSKHKLDILADYFGLGGFNHHRASDDAEMLARIFAAMTEKFAATGIRTVASMSSVMAEKIDVLKLPVYHIIILVRNRTGLKNLYKLISKSYLDYYRRFPRIPKTLLSRYREGLIIGSACSEGQLFSAMLENRSRSDLLEMAEFYDYIEVQPLSNNGYLIANGSASGRDDLIQFNRELISIADEAGKPVCATCDAHFVEPYDELYRKILLAGMKYQDADRDAGLYLRTTEEMLEEFSYLGNDKAEEIVIDNTNMIADMIESDIRPFPKGTFTPRIDGAEEDLQRICYEHAENQYGSPLPEIVKARLDKELTSIINNGYAMLYITAQKLVSYSESQGYLVGSRGSVGSSFVATMAGISEVNPLPPHYYCPKCRFSDFSNEINAGSGFDLPDKTCPVCGEKLRGDGHNIPFETFLGFHGEKLPDIDLNFSGEVQGKVHKYTEELFGSENVFRAGTIGTLAGKTVYGYIAKYLEERGISVNRAEIQRIENHCVNVKRTTGQHPGGIVVVPKEYEIYDFCPVQHPADKSESDIITTHFTFEYLHDTLLKLDELGHDIPTKYKWLEKYSGTSVLDVPMNDPEIYKLFTSTKPLGASPEEIGANIGTYGLPELGTSFVMKMVEESKPKCFADMLQISGLSHGTDVWTDNAQNLIKNGTCTISEVIGCRDNIMNDLIRYGVNAELSFKIMESVRKGRGLKPDWVVSMTEAGVPSWYIDSCRKIKYMFPKAHAAAYVMSAIRLGWYKIYMPVVFYAAYFSAAPDGFDAEMALSGKKNVCRIMSEIEKKPDRTQKEGKEYSALTLINECYARGVGFLPVDYEKSAPFAFVPENGKIRLPFNSLPGVGESASQSIADARDSGVFTIEELKTKAKLTKSVVDVLRRNGVIKCLSETNQMTFF